MSPAALASSRAARRRACIVPTPTKPQRAHTTCAARSCPNLAPGPIRGRTCRWVTGRTTEACAHVGRHRPLVEGLPLLGRDGAPVAVQDLPHRLVEPGGGALDAKASRSGTIAFAIGALGLRRIIWMSPSKMLLLDVVADRAQRTHHGAAKLSRCGAPTSGATRPSRPIVIAVFSTSERLVASCRWMTGTRCWRMPSTYGRMSARILIDSPSAHVALLQTETKSG